MRNQGLEVAKSFNCNYLLIIDADEFYHPDDFIDLLKYISTNPLTGSYWSRFQIPFKNPEYIINKEEESLPVAMKISSDLSFVNRRIPNGTRIKLPANIVVTTWDSYYLTNECWKKP